MATHTPAGFLRKAWGFLRMPEHDEKKWTQFKQVFDAKRIPVLEGSFFGADKDISTLSGCRTQQLQGRVAEQIDSILHASGPLQRAELGKLRALAATRPVTLLTATRAVDISQAAVLAQILRQPVADAEP